VAIDIHHDTHFKTLRELDERIEFPSYVQEYALDAQDRQMADYAWPEKTACPVDSKAATYLSVAYQLLADGKEAAPQPVMDKLQKCALLHGIEKDVVDLIQTLEPKEEKQAFAFETTDGNRPIKLFPLRTTDDWRFAQDTFQQHWLRYPPEWREKIAQSLIKTQPGLAPDDMISPCVQAFAKVAACNAAILREDIYRRANETALMGLTKPTTTLLKIAESLDSTTGLVKDQDFLTKLAETLTDLDEITCLVDRYGTLLKSPHEAIWNTSIQDAIEKVASYVTFSGDVYDVKSIRKALPKLKEVLGSGFAEAVSSSPDDLHAILESLPKDSKYLALETLRGEGISPSAETY